MSRRGDTSLYEAKTVKALMRVASRVQRERIGILPTFRRLGQFPVCDHSEPDQVS